MISGKTDAAHHFTEPQIFAQGIPNGIDAQEQQPQIALPLSFFEATQRLSRLPQRRMQGRDMVRRDVALGRAIA